MCALNHLRRYGGPAAGPDGEQFMNLGRMDRWALVRELRDRLRRDSYTRGPLRPCRVPKRPGSSEMRTIWVANLDDRIVSGGAAQILVPLLEPAIDPLTFRWRRR